MNRLLSLLFVGLLMVTAACPAQAARPSVLDGDLQIKGAISSNSLALSTPLTKANANNSLKRKVIVVPITNGTIADSATYTVTLPILQNCTITAMRASIGTAIVGGTNTLTISKNGSTTLLSTANVNPTTFAANAATALTLTSTAANLNLVAGDIIKFVHVAGTQSTDGVGESVAVEFESDDF